MHTHRIMHKISGFSKFPNLDNDLKFTICYLHANLSPYFWQNHEICLIEIVNVFTEISLDSDCYTGQYLNRTGGGCCSLSGFGRVPHWTHCSSTFLRISREGRGTVQTNIPSTSVSKCCNLFLKPPWQAKWFLHMNLSVWVTHIVPLQNYKLLHVLDLWLTCSIYEISIVTFVSTEGVMFLTTGYSEIDKFWPLMLKSFPTVAPKQLLEYVAKVYSTDFLIHILLDSDDLIQMASLD